MKKLVLVWLLIGISGQEISAQATWKREMLLQIAALKSYIEYAQKGYSVVRNGLTFIGDLKKGELSLHSDYFKSLKKINPKIKKYAKVAQIVFLQLEIIKISNRTIKKLRQTDLFHSTELGYIERSFKRLFENCNTTLDELLIVTTETDLELKDNQRLEWIDLLYATMMDNYLFCQKFSSDALLLSLSKVKEQNDARSETLLYGL